MTETPASVDGGPDLLSDKAATDIIAHVLSRYDARTVNPQAYPPMPAHFDLAREIVAAWNTRRPSTSPAALREEGRVQERARVVEWHREQAELCLKVAAACLAPGGTGVTVYDRWRAFAELYRKNANLIERGDHQTPTPDASQGSAPVDRFADGWRACQEAATKACIHEAPPLRDDDHTSLRDEDYGSGVRSCVEAIRALAPPAAPQGSPPRQYCVEGCSEYPRCAHASLPPGALLASPQGSPLPGRGRRKDGRPRVGSDEWKLLNRTAERDALQEQVDRLLDEKARNPPEGGALEGEMAEALRLALRVIDQGEASPADEAGLNEAGMVLARYDASKAIPQSGDEKEGT